jgi:hypothetical protein
MQRSCAKNNIQERLDVYKSTMADDKIIPVRAWNAAAQIACPKIKVNLNVCVCVCTCPPVSRGSVSITRYQSLNLTPR